MARMGLAGEERGWLRGRGEDAAAATLHLAGATPTGTAAVVLGPFGWDDMCSYRARRALAVDLAGRGVPTVRIDLPGTGDSAAGPWTPGRLDAWVDAASAAAAHVRGRTRARRVVAVGFGLGGLVAHLAAARGAPIDDLALWGTAARGRAIVRELHALSMLEDVDLPDPDAPEGTIVAAGYALTAETAAALRAVDLAATPLPGPTGRRVLLLERDGLPPDARLASALGEAGADVRVALGPGWGEMLAEPQFSRLPSAALATLADFVAARELAPSPLDSPPAPAWTAKLDLPGGVVERPEDVDGSSGHVPAVVTEPAAHDAALTVVWLNAGPQRRIGPNRLWVTTARRWAARGVRVVRVDLAGFGDASTDVDLSAVGAFHTGPHLEQVRALLDALRAQAPTRFVLGGLCAGANWAGQAAETDTDVAGLLLINASTFHFDRRTFELTDARWMLRQLADPATWRKVVRGQVNWRRPLRLARAVALQLAGAPRRLLRRPRAPASAPQAVPSPDERTLAALPGRGDRMAIIFSGDEALATTLEDASAFERLAALDGAAVHHVGVRDRNTHTLRPLAIQRDVERILDAELEAVLARTAVRA